MIVAGSFGRSIANMPFLKEEGANSFESCFNLSNPKWKQKEIVWTQKLR
jgi:hypothetical protein